MVFHCTFDVKMGMMKTYKYIIVLAVMINCCNTFSRMLSN